MDRRLPDDIPPPAAPSKTRRKRDMHALQDLGERLAKLSSEQIARIAMPEELREAITEARRITKHEARRRQMQYIGRLMRDADPEPIREALDTLAGNSAAETARQHRIERLRRQLIEDEAVLGSIALDHPDADLQHLRQLRRNALKEQEQGKPPKAFRELFRALRTLGEESGAGREEQADLNPEILDPESSILK
jgi:ribosome-associated protein